MELNGKCEIEFNEWYVTNDEWDDMTLYTNIDGYNPIVGFEDIHPSMKYGVYVDFFDSVGIQVSNRPYFDTFEWKVDMIDHEKKKVDMNSDAELTRTEARTQAITKANELYNGK